MIPHAFKQQLITRLAKPEAMLLRGAWPREMKLVNQLLARYPDQRFWLSFDPGYTLNSFAHFKSERGAAELQQAYNLHLFALAQIALDSQPKPAKLEDTTDEPVKKRLSVPQWADSMMMDHSELNHV